MEPKGLLIYVIYHSFSNQVVNYAAFNEEEIKATPRPTATPIQKLWEEIIPAEERAKVEAEKLEDLKLKPRSRKAVEKVSLKFLLRKSH